jgi:hypothetical protein
VGDMSLSIRSHAISVAYMAWNGEHRVFVMQLLFCRHFGVGRH